MARRTTWRTTGETSRRCGYAPVGEMGACGDKEQILLTDVPIKTVKPKVPASPDILMLMIKVTKPRQAPPATFRINAGRAARLPFSSPAI